MFTDQSSREIDSEQFREYTSPKVKDALDLASSRLQESIKQGSSDNLVEVVLVSSEELNKAITDTNAGEPIFSTPDTAVTHGLGMILWKRPSEAKQLEIDILSDLSKKLVNGEIDTDRFSKGVYFSQVLIHKFENGNGRVARGLRSAINLNAPITIGETRKVLGIGKEALSQTGKNSFKMNFNPDVERVTLGIAYFAVEKYGLTQDEVVNDMKLSSSIQQDEGIKKLADRMGKTFDETKREFIHYMVVDSSLQWCKFD